MNENKVSVIILTYNRADLVCKTVKSVIKQSYKNLEIIIIDDGSKDDTLKRLKIFNDKRIIIHSLNHSGQISKLRNLGIQKSNGKYIAFLDSDDIWRKNHLEQQIKKISESNNLGFVFSDLEIIQDNKIIIKDIYKGKLSTENCNNLFYKLISGEITPIRHSTILFNKKCIEKIGVFDEKYLAGDYNFLLKLVYKFEGIYCNKPRVQILKHSNNISDYIQIQDFKEVVSTVEEFYKIGAIDKKLYKQRIFFFKNKIIRAYIKKREIIKAIKHSFNLLMIILT